MIGKTQPSRSPIAARTSRLGARASRDGSDPSTGGGRANPSSFDRSAGQRNGRGGRRGPVTRSYDRSSPLHPCTPLRELTELLSIDWAFPTFSNQASAVHQAALARATVRSPHDYVQHRKSHVAPPWPVWHWGLVGREGSIAPQVNARKGGRPLASPAGAPKRSGNRTPAGHRTARHPCGYASFYQVLGLSRNYGGRTRART
jgi:hypothetical protein